MKASLRTFLSFALLAASALASLSDVEIQRRAEENADDLEQWLEATQRVSPESLNPCPVSCDETGNGTSRSEWFLIPDATKLALCNETMLLDMVVQAAAQDDKTSPPIIRACTANYDSGVKVAFVPDDDKASLCTTANQVLEEASIFMHHPETGNDDAFSVNHLLSAAHQITNHLALQKPSCGNNAMEFAYSQSSAIGLFAGAEIHQHGVTVEVLKKLLDYAQKTAVSKTTVIQLCGKKGRGADYSIGIVAASEKNLPFIHETVKTWANGGCVSQADAGEDWMKVTLRVPVPVEAVPTNGTEASNNTTPAHLGARSRLEIRADCKTTTVIAGDGCWAVAKRCGISQPVLEKYNRANLCKTLVKDEKICCSSGTLPITLPPGNPDGTCKTRAVVSGDVFASLAKKCGISVADFTKANPKLNPATLAVGQQVCCTRGTLPNLKPKPDANGNCATYTIKQDDSCSVIAAARGLTVTELEGFNKKTWGWNGCKLIFPAFKMCVSTGNPPLPAVVAVSFVLISSFAVPLELLN